MVFFKNERLRRESRIFLIQFDSGIQIFWNIHTLDKYFFGIFGRNNRFENIIFTQYFFGHYFFCKYEAHLL